MKGMSRGSCKGSRRRVSYFVLSGFSSLKFS